MAGASEQPDLDTHTSVATAGRPVAYYEDDFDWHEHAAACHAARTVRVVFTQPCAAALRLDLAAQSTSWHAFYERHAGFPFFKPRRYLGAAFPVLRSATSVLELGLGCGASALALLSADPACRVVGVDCAPAAVAAASRAAALAGCADRLLALCLDPAALAGDFAAALDAAMRRAGWPRPAAFDAALAAFTLSALPPDRLAHFVAAAASVLRPGTALCVRDYGLHDKAHEKLLSRGDGAGMPLTVSDGEARLFARADGTLARFFELGELVAQVGAASGLPCVFARYSCVETPNRALGTRLRRVFVTAQFGGAG